MLKEKVRRLAENYFRDTVSIRRHLHQYPELSFEEKETGRFVAQKLEEFGVPFVRGIADNGVVGLIKGKNPNKKTIALRADMDALPIEEANEVVYKSKRPGLMHACGHDVHTSSLLGTARILNDLRNEFEGTIKLIFQPGEERLPGGASIMIKEGVLENPKPLSIFGQHVHPPLPAGKVGFRSGKFMASADELFVTVHGKGGHGASPESCIDPILIASHLVLSLQQIVSRNASPRIPTVLTFGRINSTGGHTNIIPNEVKLIGTFRTMDENWRFEAHRRMKKMAESIAEGMGGSCDFNIVVGYPTLFNNEALTEKARNAAIEYLGVNNVEELPIRLASEDFSYYSQEMPACFYRLGINNPAKGITSGVHTNTFDVDEDCLETSTGLMAWLALKELGDGN